MSSTAGSETTGTEWGPLQWAGAVLAWLWVLVPFGYGLYRLVINIPAIFG
jgi:hypothetical protein